MEQRRKRESVPFVLQFEKNLLRAQSAVTRKNMLVASRKRPRPSLVQALKRAAQDACRSPTAIYFDDDVSKDPHTQRAAALQLLESYPEEAHDMLAAIASTVSSSSSSVPDPESAALDAWMDQFMPWVGTPRLALRRFDLTGRGLAATGDVVAGEAVLHVPRSLVLTAASLPSHPLLDAWHGDLRLATALLLEPLHHPNGAWSQYVTLLLLVPSSWSPLLTAFPCGTSKRHWCHVACPPQPRPLVPHGRYMRLLPSVPPSALHWSERQLSSMGGTPLPAQVVELHATLRAAHAAAFPTLTDDLPRCFPRGIATTIFSLERFVWAYSIVETRGLMLSLGPGCPRTACLVPVADMCNHAPTAALAWPRIEHVASHAHTHTAEAAGDADVARFADADGREEVGEDLLVFRTLRGVGRGSEVHLYYGRLPSLQTLQYYGFVDEGALSIEVSDVDACLRERWRCHVDPLLRPLTAADPFRIADPFSQVIQIDLELPDEEVMLALPDGLDGAPEEAQQAWLEEMAPRRAEEQSKRRAALLAARGLTLGPHYLRDAPELAPRLLQALNVLCMSAADVQETTAATKAGDAAVGAASAERAANLPASAEQTRRVCDGLRGLLTSLAESLAVPATSGEDAGSEDATVNASIALYVAFQRRVLRHGLAAVTRMEAAIEGEEDE